MGVLAGTIPGITMAAGNTPSRKKGWAGGSVRMHGMFGMFGTHWCYTWSPKTRPSVKTEFVPMMKGEWSLKETGAIRKMGGISHLLSFNEPERKEQGNVSLDRAIELWPRLVALAKEYDLPVWVTEFNGWSGEERDHYDFLKDSLRFLEKSRYVERCAYFNPPAGKAHSLLSADGKLTRMGELCRDAGR